MQKLKNDNGYRITKAEWGYYITIASTKANQYRHYEYDGACGTFEEVEKFLQEHTFDEVAKAFYEQCVYCECVEPIY